MTKPKQRPAPVTTDASVDPFPPDVPRDEAGNIATGGEVSPEQLRAIGAMDAESVLANKHVADKVKAMAGHNPTSISWGSADHGVKYDATMENFCAGSKVLIKRVKPADRETTYSPISAESVRTWDDFVSYVRNTIWDGEKSTFDWAIRTGSLSRAVGSLPLDREQIAVDSWRERTQPPAIQPTYPPRQQHLGAPPMQQPPWGGQPPHGYAHQQTYAPYQPPAPAPAAAPAPPPQPVILQAPPAPAPQGPPRVKLPDGSLGWVIDGEVVVPASYMQQPPAPAPAPYQPPPPVAAPAIHHQRVKLPDGSLGFVIDGEVVVPWAQQAAQRQAPAPVPAPAPPPPQYAPPAYVAGPPGLPPMPPAVQPFWNPYKNGWDYPQIHPPQPPAPPQAPAPPVQQHAAPPGAVPVPGEDMSTVARNLGKTLQQLREVGSAIQPFASLVGLQPANLGTPPAAGTTPEGEKKWDPDNGIFDMGFGRTLKKPDGSPDLDFGLGHIALNYDKIGEQVKSAFEARDKSATLNVELEERRARTRALDLETEMRRRAFENGGNRQGGGFPVSSQESSPSLPAHAQGGFNPLAALHGPPTHDENSSDTGGGEGPTTAE